MNVGVAARPADSRPEPTIAAISRAPGGHVPELDALRALAIWAVLAAHLLFTAPATAASSAFLPHWAHTLLLHGWLGVDLFFVLSGFLITGILLGTKPGGRSAYFKRFYIRRAARILPLYFAVLLVLFVVSRGQYGAYFALCALMSADFANLFGVAIPDAAGPYWSLGVEEQFYLIWPWLVLWLDRKRLAWAALAVVVVEPVLRYGARPHDLELVWFRADGLALGAYLATWFAAWDGDRRRARTLALALVGVAVAIAAVGIPFGILDEGRASTSLRITQAVLVFGAFLVVAVAYSGSPALAFMRSRATAVTALLSYCLYLVHKPLTDAFAWAARATPFGDRLAPEPALFV
ncbi:MAG: acyltransferase, partial [Candidatus Eremiobacteraeota bacterium]|nr:acyltransferase [Candidatus Eremiobacteraeota bacterium]